MRISVFYSHITEASKQTGLPINELLSMVHSFGIDSVELDMNDLSQPDVIYQSLKNAGLTVSSIYGLFDFGSYPEAKQGYRLIDLAVRMNADKILVIPGLLKGNTKEEQLQEKKNMLMAMKEICEYANQHKVTVTIEDYDNKQSPILDSAGMLWFTEQLPLLQVAFDTGNFMFSCESELTAFQTFKDRIVHIHCKDRSIIKVEGEQPLANLEGTLMYSSPVGYGCIKMKEIIQLLKEMDYKGTLAIEHFGALDQLGYMKKSADWIKSQIR